MRRSISEVEDKLKEGISVLEFSHMEDEVNLPSFEQELDYYQLVKNGEVEILMEKFGDYKEEGKGILSKDPIRNTKYHLVILTSLFARYCIEGGLEHMEAYNMSDYYINRIDCCITKSELDDMYQEILFGYAKKMRELRRQKKYSKPVIQSNDYIGKHLNQRIYINEIAQYVNLNANYLETLYKRETGVSITEFIRRKRIDVAKRMLQYTDYSFVDISNHLAFNSHSHFISVFKRYVGVTPLEYRKRYYRMMPKVDDPYRTSFAGMHFDTINSEQPSFSPEQSHGSQQEGTI